MQRAPSPEFQLVCACCRWPQSEARNAAIRAAAAPTLDWDRVAAIARRHRVWSLVADGVRAAGLDPPPEIAALLRDRSKATARKNLAAVAATLQLGRQLDAAGIDWLCFKGLPLTIQAYGALSVKASNDIDILVPQADTARAAALLDAAGYRRFNPPPDQVPDDRLDAWMQVSKEAGWRHPATGIIVELHARMTANPALLPQGGIASPRQTVALARGIEVATLADEMLLPYLAAHGAHSGWVRLKWLADYAAMLMRDPAAIEPHHRAAQALGVGRCAAQGLLLAHDLLGLPLPPALEAELRSRFVHRLLVRIARRSMAGDYEAREHPAGETGRSMLPVTLGNLLLRRGPGYKWRELAALAANPRDRATGRLPRGLGFLYPLLGGVRWSARMLGLIDRPQGAG